jgi:hypothetical protein
VVTDRSLEHGEDNVAVCLSQTGAYTVAYGFVSAYGKNHRYTHRQEDIDSALRDLGDSFEGDTDSFGGGDPGALFYVTARLCEVGP